MIFVDLNDDLVSEDRGDRGRPERDEDAESWIASGSATAKELANALRLATSLRSGAAIETMFGGNVDMRSPPSLSSMAA